MNNRARWGVAGLIVAVAVVVAAWPRSHDDPSGPAATTSAAPASAPDLAGARTAAGLAPCAAPAGPVPAGLAELAAVTAECLADGAPANLAAQFAGRAVLLNVWATWCQPCAEELPVLAEYAAAPGAVPVVGLAVRSDPAGALKLVTRLGVRFTNLIDSGDAGWRALGVPNALPASYLIGPDGTVRFVSDPRLFRSADQVRQTVAHYLPSERNGSP
ncbi:TlpA disulfide reductase family protein [Actinophytocola sp.]|uniref:TlpA family protein disulfide reductase n=1 Tax=Actinophytocola sp. TaxID=1872138 RepID=UPI002D7E2356|nr:TlpA disulfide reductase family protein [Actinophytocola sp.]HET9143852.1 TlpA disulfide reductase family protein [Actinophytocola sp.]